MLVFGSQGRYDLILLDTMLPDMTGEDILKEISRKTDACFAFLSAVPLSAKKEVLLREYNVYDYILKPFEKDDLINRVNRIIKP